LLCKKQAAGEILLRAEFSFDMSFEKLNEGGISI